LVHVAVKDDGDDQVEVDVYVGMVFAFIFDGDVNQYSTFDVPVAR